MKFCYCDESGTGDEPIAVMAGIVADANRMHTTKEEWNALLEHLSIIAGKRIDELHAKDFYPGNGIWRGVPGLKRSEIVSQIIDWLTERKHNIVYCAVLKQRYFDTKSEGKMKDELNTIWRFLGFHLVLAMQRFGQQFDHNKGHTVFVFDNEYKEELRFTDLILRPPRWSDGYYDRKARQGALDQLVDVPYFGDSRDVGLIQIADFLAYFLRRYAEIKEGCGKRPHDGEAEKVIGWVDLLSKRSIGRTLIYPKSNRSEAAELFYSHAPDSIRTLA